MNIWIWPDRDWRAYWATQRVARRNTSLRAAYDRYWNSKTHFEQQAAYYEILLKGGRDGYSNVGRVRSWIAQKLRALAAFIDDFD